MITLYIVRHGETTYNLQGRIQGHLDAPLSDLGVKQAQSVACRLADENIDAIYSSDLGRARSTAEVIAAQHNLPIQESPLIRESNLGILQGLTRAEIDVKYPAAEHEWRRNPLTMRPPGAESREEVIERSLEFTKQLQINHGEAAKLVIVGHGGSLRGLIIAALDLPVSAYRMMHFSNASLSIIDIGEQPAIWLLNDTCHLNSLRTDEEEVDTVAH